MDISEIRKQIDDIDNELCALIERRMSLSSEIADYKRRCRLPVLDSAREEEIIARLTHGCGEDVSQCIRSVYRELFFVSRGLQERKINDENCD